MVHPRPRHGDLDTLARCRGAHTGSSRLLSAQVDVKLSVRGQHGGRATDAHHQRDQIVEITVYTLRHGIVRVEDTETDNMYAAIDLVTDKLKRKLNKVKVRLI
jgi:ribosomal subunit interface protein